MANQDIVINVGLGSGLIGSAASLFVDASGAYWRRQGVKNGFRTLQKAVNASRPGTVIYVAPGRYNETVTIPRTHGGNLTIVGVGGRGSAFVEPGTEDADGVICHADDVEIRNLGIAAEDESAGNVALEVSGARFRAYGCKIEGGATQVVIGPGTVAQEAAGSRGGGADFLFDDCEFCWGTNGIILTCTDYGAVTQGRIQNSRFHNLTTKHITESVGSGGSAAVTFQNLTVDNCTFDDLDDGTAPTNYIDLNADNANSGVISRCVFPTAINSGLNLVSTAVHWVSNYHTGGVSAAQPS
jgi:hypothetical protein